MHNVPRTHCCCCFTARLFELYDSGPDFQCLAVHDLTAAVTEALRAHLRLDAASSAGSVAGGGGYGDDVDYVGSLSGVVANVARGMDVNLVSITP